MSYSKKKAKESQMDNNVFGEIVEKEVALLVAKDECFTCFDVTKALRGWMNKDVDHQEVCNIVHGLYGSDAAVFFNNGYIRSTCQFADGTLVEVFHSAESDGQDYIDVLDALKSIQPTGCCSQCTCGDEKERIEDLERENGEMRNILTDLLVALSRAEDTLDDVDNRF
jgi:hypothetical protein